MDREHHEGFTTTSVRPILRWEVQNLLKRLSDIGEHSIVLSANVTDANVNEMGLMGAGKGEGFLLKYDLMDVKHQFLLYCKGKDEEQLKILKTLNQDTLPTILTEAKDLADKNKKRKRKRSQGKRKRKRKASKLSDEEDTESAAEHDTVPDHHNLLVPSTAPPTATGPTTAEDGNDFSLVRVKTEIVDDGYYGDQSFAPYQDQLLKDQAREAADNVIFNSERGTSNQMYDNQIKTDPDALQTSENQASNDNPSLSGIRMKTHHLKTRSRSSSKSKSKSDATSPLNGISSGLVDSLDTSSSVANSPNFQSNNEAKCGSIEPKVLSILKDEAKGSLNGPKLSNEAKVAGNGPKVSKEAKVTANGPKGVEINQTMPKIIIGDQENAKSKGPALVSLLSRSLLNQIKQERSSSNNSNNSSSYASSSVATDSVGNLNDGGSGLGSKQNVSNQIKQEGLSSSHASLKTAGSHKSGQSVSYNLNETDNVQTHQNASNEDEFTDLLYADNHNTSTVSVTPKSTPIQTPSLTPKRRSRTKLKNTARKSCPSSDNDLNNYTLVNERLGLGRDFAGELGGEETFLTGDYASGATAGMLGIESVIDDSSEIIGDSVNSEMTGRDFGAMDTCEVTGIGSNMLNSRIVIGEDGMMQMIPTSIGEIENAKVPSTIGEAGSKIMVPASVGDVGNMKIPIEDVGHIKVVPATIGDMEDSNEGPILPNFSKITDRPNYYLPPTTTSTTTNRPACKGFKAAANDEDRAETALLDASKLEIGRYQCPVCYLITRDRHDLKRHLRTHTKDKPYQCPICLRKFTRKWDLENHLTRHENATNIKVEKRVIANPDEVYNRLVLKILQGMQQGLVGLELLDNNSCFIDDANGVTGSSGVNSDTAGINTSGNNTAGIDTSVKGTEIDTFGVDKPVKRTEIDTSEIDTPVKGTEIDTSEIDMPIKGTEIDTSATVAAGLSSAENSSSATHSPSPLATAVQSIKTEEGSYSPLKDDCELDERNIKVEENPS